MSFYMKILSPFTVCLFLVTSVNAASYKKLAYPSGELTGLEIAEQVYFVNHLFGLKNYGVTKSKDESTIIISKSRRNKRYYTILERFINNEYDDGIINSKDISIFRSGKLRGTGILVTDFVKEGKSHSFAVWIPSLRKIKRFAQPKQNASWGGTDFTFGDVTLRQPENEHHEIMGTEIFKGCLGAIADIKHDYLKTPPEPACNHNGKKVYKLKSTTKFSKWWYDYRISYIDVETFGDYRTEYYRNDKQVKVIDRNWIDLKQDDKRIQAWGYWYGKTLSTNHETWAIVPMNIVKINQDWNADKWTERTLRKIKR